jgi:hypothetical protein
MLRPRRLTFDWIDLNRGGVDQAATAANAAVGAASTATADCPWGWLGRGLCTLDRRCGLPLSSAVWTCSNSGHSRATVPFVLTLLGDNLGPQVPPGSVSQRLLDLWDATWKNNDENGSEGSAGNSYIDGTPGRSGGFGSIANDSEGDEGGGFEADSIQVISSIGGGGSLGGHGDGRGHRSRGGEPLGALELETARAWLRQPAAACEGLVSPMISIPVHLNPFTPSSSVWCTHFGPSTLRPQ